MSRHPCKAGPDGTPCNRFRKGEAYDISRECRLCWNFHHVIAYNLAWGGDGKVTPAPSAPVAASPATPKPMLLGDAVESALSFVGVTKDRVQAWIGGPCGCKERQERLNRLHLWAKSAMGGTVEKARGWLHKLIGD